MERLRNARAQYCVKRAILFITGAQATILTIKKGAVHFFTLYLTNRTEPIFQLELEFDTRKAIFLQFMSLYLFCTLG